MDNPIKGETSFEAGGKSYTLVFDNNAWCALETHLNRGIMDIYEEIGSWSPKVDGAGKPLPETPEQAKARALKIRLGFCRAMFWAGLQKHHKGLSEDQAGDLMDQAGGLFGVMNIIAKGAATAQPTIEERGPASPPMGSRKRRGTGSAS